MDHLGRPLLPTATQELRAYKAVETEGVFEWTIDEPARLPVFVGGRSDKLFGFEGKLDEVAVFDRALSAAEVAAQFKLAERVAPPRKEEQKSAGK